MQCLLQAWLIKIMFKENSIFIIAEAGINHNGDFKTAEKLITVAKECGADAIKFQFFIADELVIEEAQKAEHVSKNKQSFFEMIKSWELAVEEYGKLTEFAQEQDIIFFASVLGKEPLRIMEKFNAPLYKVASCDLNNHSLLKEIAETKKPIIISTGMGNTEEIKQAVEILEKNDNKIGILHCVSLYPPNAEELNLQRISILQEMFPGHAIGYSDHSLNIFVPASTIFLGARIIEKHFTLDKGMEGPDQPSSADPKEFKQMVGEIRYLEKAINFKDKNIEPGEREKKMKEAFRRSIVANEFIPAGSVITEDKLGVKRPGTGIPSSEMLKVVGKKAKRDLARNTIIKYSDLV